jgi:two-component system alkaline phosphatase synthesis response regulator PhoP
LALPIHVGVNDLAREGWHSVSLGLAHGWERSLPRSILIVDDEQHIRLLIEQALEDLEDEGVELVTAADGDEALGAVEQHRPELIFLDIMMPKRNGFEVCRAIKQEIGLRDSVVVMLTAKGQVYDREQGLAAGADLYITKPFDPDQLLQTARTVLEL